MNVCNFCWSLAQKFPNSIANNNIINTKQLGNIRLETVMHKIEIALFDVAVVQFVW